MSDENPETPIEPNKYEFTSFWGCMIYGLFPIRQELQKLYGPVDISDTKLISSSKKKCII